MSQIEQKAFVFKVQNFSIHDGEGIRTVVFFKACNLHCYWCHNPESWSPKMDIQFFNHLCISCGECGNVCTNANNGQIALFSNKCTKCGKCVDNCFAKALVKVGYYITVSELMEIIEKDKDVFDSSGGGVTFSGGEPLLQSDFLLEILKKCKEKGINTAIETAACVKWEILEKVLPYLDQVFCDIKSIDSQKHFEATGVRNELILGNIRKMCENSVNLCLRTPVIPEFNKDEKSMRDIANFLSTLPKKYQKIELLGFHSICSGKYESLNKEFKAKDLPQVDKKQLSELSKYFEEKEISVKY